jgi:hypothetical protein
VSLWGLLLVLAVFLAGGTVLGRSMTNDPEPAPGIIQWNGVEKGSNMSGDPQDSSKIGASLKEATGLEWCLGTDDPSSCFPKTCAEGTKKALVVVGADWCGWCGKFKKETLSNAKVIERLKRLGLVYIDATTAQKAARAVGATGGIPYFVFVDKDCKTKIFSNIGYLPPHIFLQLLDAHGM